MKGLYLACALMVTFSLKAEACTGITLRTTSGSPVPARTIEWAGNDLQSCYAIVPRGYRQRSYVPGGDKEGMAFTAKYGYVGLAVQQPEFVVDGLNEAGLAAGLFYFPEYGEYETYDATKKQNTVSDLQLVSWILSNFKTIDEVKAAIAAVQPKGYYILIKGSNGIKLYQLPETL